MPRSYRFLCCAQYPDVPTTLLEQRLPSGPSALHAATAGVAAGSVRDLAAALSTGVDDFAPAAPDDVRAGEIVRTLPAGVVAPDGFVLPGTFAGVGFNVPAGFPTGLPLAAVFALTADVDAVVGLMVTAGFTVIAGFALATGFGTTDGFIGAFGFVAIVDVVATFGLGAGEAAPVGVEADVGFGTAPDFDPLDTGVCAWRMVAPNRRANAVERTVRVMRDDIDKMNEG